MYRLRGLAFERDVLCLQAEAAAEQVARDFLRLRDYANTPIQTIVFATELLRARSPDLEPILARIDRAAKRLMEPQSSAQIVRVDAQLEFERRV